MIYENDTYKMTDINKVKEYLTSNYMHTSTAWVNACVEWYKTENGENIPQNILNEAIREQWLLCDLRDIEIGSFPENLKSFKKIILSGTYAVQMEYLIDSSQPAYSQLQQLRQINVINEEVTAPKSEYPKVKANRVFNLFLCDGLQEVQGMEFKPIPKLTTNLTPGVKMLLMGPIECRNGVLFLHDRNIRILGGEIETLLCKNAYENVLNRILNLPENPKPLNPNSQLLPRNEMELMKMNDDDFMEDFCMQEFGDIQLPMEVTNTSVQNSTTLPQIEQINKDVLENYELVDNSLKKDNNTTKTCENQNTRHTSNQNPQTSLITANSSTHSMPIRPPSVEQVDNRHNINTINNYQNETDDDFTEALRISNGPQIVSPRPYVYIRQLLENRQNICSKLYTVKAYVKSIVTKLSFVKKKWALKCEITDVSGSLIVEFCNEVLEEIIGYTADEMNTIKRQMATSNFYKDQLLQALDKAKDKILSLDCLMKISFRKPNEEPLLVDIQTISYLHVTQLRQRIDNI